MLLWYLSLIVALTSIKGNLFTPQEATGSSAIGRTTHDEKVSSILQNLSTNRSPSQQIVLKRAISQSHCPRPQHYKSDKFQLDVSNLNRIISVKYVSESNDRIEIPSAFAAFKDDITAAVDVEGMVSFEDLVDYLIPLGLIPAVVPEFKGITVGGSLQGLAAESTSFKYGFVHDAIVEFDIILGNGEIRRCNPKNNADIFYQLPGSFGSLGICTRIRMLCIKAQPLMKVTVKLHENQAACVKYMGELQDHCLVTSGKKQNSGKRHRISHFFRPHPKKKEETTHEKINDVDAIEGIVCRHDQALSIEACFICPEGAVASKLDQHRCNGWLNKWFFNQAKDLIPTLLEEHKQLLGNSSITTASQPSVSFLLPTKDYLFRHDQGSFWMAAYRIPQVIGRVMGPLLDSSSMFSLANALPWVFPKSVICLQDFMVPRTQVCDFYDKIQDLLQLYPIWLLPMRNIEGTSKGQRHRSIFAVPPGLKGHLCNVGSYGIPSKNYQFIEVNQEMEKILDQHNGRKVFYSHAFYDKEYFYDKLYDGKRYFALRDKLHATKAFPEIYDKIITKDGKL